MQSTNQISSWLQYRLTRPQLRDSQLSGVTCPASLLSEATGITFTWSQ